MSDLKDLLTEILNYSPTEKSETEKKGENRPFRSEMRPCENGLNSTFPPLSPSSPLKSNSPDEKSSEQRRKKVLQMLTKNPDAPRAFFVDDDNESICVIVAVAIRGVATFELEMPRSKYDPFLFVDLIGAGIQ